MVKAESIELVREIFKWPSFGRGAGSVWLRNFLYFRYTLWVSLLWVVVEPLLFFAAIGHILGSLIGTVNGQPYAVFFAPALMAASGMLVSFFEGAFGCYTKLSKQRTYHIMLLTPLKPQDIAIGEIAWAASKGFMSVLAVALVAYLQGMLNTWMVFPALLILFLFCWLIAALGLVLATSARHYDGFIYAQTGLIMPMYLFSGTFFPLSLMSEPVRNLAYLLPLTHAVEISRDLLAGHWEHSMLIHVGVIVSMAFFFTNWAIAGLKKKTAL